MWILDCQPSRNSVNIWIKKESGKVVLRKFKFENSFLMHFPDKILHFDLIEALETKYRVEECSFRTIYGEMDGYRVYAGRRIAEKVERQCKDVKLFNVDVRSEQKLMAEKRFFPCSHILESLPERFDAEFEIPLKVMEIGVKGDVFRPEIVEMRVNGRVLAGSEKELVRDFLEGVEAEDPDVILMEDADFWMHHINRVADEEGFKNPISRTGEFIRLSQKSYWSYGRARYRREALIPEGRVLVDTSSFNFREGGLKGVLLASRISAISPNLASRLTPGSLISLYEVFEALTRGIAVPFRKSDAERTKTLEELRRSDRGGMIFQPEAGVYENVWEIDFTSMYPSIIVKYNLSPETIGSANKRGFLAEVLEPLLKLRIRTKKLKKKFSEYSGIDSMLKWMLVTCFGYTGYRNAKFGRIEVHEEINRIGREILIKTKEIVEDMGFEVIHGIVDCLWVRGKNIQKLKEKVEEETGMLTELENFDWIVFLPLKDGSGAYNRYYGRLSDGKMKLRGVMARRRDTPEYIRKMQLECFEIMSKARSLNELKIIAQKLVEVYRRYLEGLRVAKPEEMIIRKVVSRVGHRRRTLESSAIEEYRKAGVNIRAGMEVEYVVIDARKKLVSVKDHQNFDVKYYRALLEKAWKEIEFALMFLPSNQRH